MGNNNISPLFYVPLTLFRELDRQSLTRSTLDLMVGTVLCLGVAMVLMVRGYKQDKCIYVVEQHTRTSQAARRHITLTAIIKHYKQAMSSPKYI